MDLASGSGGIKNKVVQFREDYLKYFQRQEPNATERKKNS
jgi:hypothetical protein